MVLREGEAGDACYLIAAGKVRVTKAGVEVAELGPGLVLRRVRGALRSAAPRLGAGDRAARAARDPARAHRRAGGGASGRGAHAAHVLSRAAVADAAGDGAVLPAPRAPRSAASIAERFRPRRFGRGAQIIEEGAPGGGLYLILVGEVEVVRAGKAATEVTPSSSWGRSARAATSARCRSCAAASPRRR